MESWVYKWVNLGDREEGLLWAFSVLNVVKEFVTKFWQETLEYGARDA